MTIAKRLLSTCPIGWIFFSTCIHALFEEYGFSGQEAFKVVCEQGDLERLLCVVKKHKEGAIPLTSEQIEIGLQDALTGGHDAILLCLHYVWSIDTMNVEKQERLIDLALRIGYPNTVRVLNEMGCSLTALQTQTLNALKTALRAPPLLQPPPAINAEQFQAHGGEDNILLYQREYRTLVAYILHHLQNPLCDFRCLLEDLGARRRHMASLGKLPGLEFFGIATHQHMYTYFSPVYETYGQRVHETYPHLPKVIEGVLNGRVVQLTQIHDTFWQHPKGENREEILNHIALLCHKARAGGADLLHTFGSIIWWLSHAPPFLRGTPTLIYALLDAFCLHHHLPLLCKVPDLNCEALLYDNEEEFALYVLNRETP